MRVLTLNLNGIRSALRKGLKPWLEQLQPDIVLLQEVRCSSDLWNEHDLLPGYDRSFHYAQKPGYSGVGILSKHPLSHIVHHHDHLPLMEEGRLLQAQVGPLTLVNIYLPSGTSGPERHQIKIQYLESFSRYIAELKGPVLIAGDFNIVHTEKDIKNWKQNQLTSGCTLEERVWLSEFLKQYQLADTLRVLDQEENRAYTWWSARGRAFENNVGWRIDYQLISQSLASHVLAYRIEKEHRFSDHAPYIVDYDPKILTA